MAEIAAIAAIITAVAAVGGTAYTVSATEAAKKKKVQDEKRQEILGAYENNYLQTQDTENPSIQAFSDLTKSNKDLLG